MQLFQPGTPRGWAWKRAAFAVLFAITAWGCSDNLATRPEPVGPPSLYTTPWAYSSFRTVELRSRVARDRCMDVAGASREAGARVTIWECLDGPQQRFIWIPGSNEIRVYGGTGDVKCVDDGGGTLQPGDPVII
ncbi:MAG TPA: hypothetical protein VGV85_18845, partial [Longimicrobiaceae bacterium]|nr:hypothetical protein [Longimicrobiaceae bacterium]